MTVSEKNGNVAALGGFFSEKENLSPGASGILRVAVTGGIGSGKSYLCKRIEAAGHPVFYCDDEAKRIIRTDPEVQGELRRLVGEGVYDAEGRLVKSVLAAYLCRGREYSARVDAIVHPRVARAFAERTKEMEARAGGYFSQKQNKGSERLGGTAASQAQKPQAVMSPAASQAQVAQAVMSSAAGKGGFTLSPSSCSDFLTLFPRRGDHSDSCPVLAGIDDVLAACPAGRVLFMECALLYESGFARLVHRTLLVHVSAETQVRRVMARDKVTRSAALSWMALQLSEDERLRRADIVVDNEG